MNVGHVLGTLVALLVGLVLGAVLALVVLAVRRRVLRHGDGKIYFCMRVRQLPRGRGWALGIARLDQDKLRWYRAFSVSPRPQRVLYRREIAVLRQRQLRGGECSALLDGTVVLECLHQGRPVEVGLKAGAVTGFLAWLEAAPPGGFRPGARPLPLRERRAG